MNGRIVISLGLLAIALTIAGSAADGDTTPAAAEVVAATSGPEAASKPAAAGPPPAQPNAAKPNEKDSRINHNSGSGGIHSIGSGPFTCYIGGCTVDARTTCEDQNLAGLTQYKGCAFCTKKHIKVDGELFSNSRGCLAPSPGLFIPDDGCETTKGIRDGSKAELAGCACSEDLCNGSSVSSPIAFVTIAALAIAVKVNIF